MLIGLRLNWLSCSWCPIIPEIPIQRLENINFLKLNSSQFGIFVLLWAATILDFVDNHPTLSRMTWVAITSPPPIFSSLLSPVIEVVTIARHNFTVIPNECRSNVREYSAGPHTKTHLKLRFDPLGCQQVRRERADSTKGAWMRWVD